jgi:hypothetical protein
MNVWSYIYKTFQGLPFSPFTFHIDNEIRTYSGAEQNANSHNKILSGTRRCPIRMMASLADISVLLETEIQ